MVLIFYILYIIGLILALFIGIFWACKDAEIWNKIYIKAHKIFRDYNNFFKP